ncbi:T9SS type A sorting domain-containing protein [Fluviicola sp.]|uniref:T9SS type A sorting domain-containing protein n=1 Tax=Fluviicola sp. TaxID=1917219 RepID=UPI0031D82F44
MKKKLMTIVSCLFLSWSSNAQFYENFSPLYTWTQVGSDITVSGTQAKYTNCADGISNRIYTNHGVTLTDNWVLDIDFQFTAVGTGGPGHHIASVTAGTLDPVSDNSYVATNQSAIAMMFYSTNHTNTPSTFELIGTSKNGSSSWTNSAGIVLASSKTYYLRLERLDATHARISAFSDAARTVHVANSPQCFNLGSHFTNNLPVIQHGNTCWGWVDRSLTGWIDNTRLTAYTTSEIIAGNQQVCSGTGNPVAFTSTATSNNPNTSYQWQSSTDGGATWTDIVSATSLTYDPPAGPTQTTLYRRITKHSTCLDQHISNTLTVSIVECNSLTCDYSNDFSSSANWTTVGTGVTISGGTFNYNTCPDAASIRMHTNHGVSLSNSWRLDFDFRYTAVGTGGPGHHLASLTAGTLDPTSTASPWAATNQDAVFAMFGSTNHTNNPATFMLMGGSKNNADPWITSLGILLTQNTQYYITLERLDQTHGRISAYSDAARLNHIANSPQCFDIDQNVTSNLSVLQHGNTSWGGSDRNLTGTIDNDCLSLLDFTGGKIGKDQKVPCGTAPGSILSTAPASGPNSSYTFTYQWQSSTDNINWTNISAANSLNYSPPLLYVTTYYRRVAIGPCGMLLFSNTVVKSMSLNAALDSEFSVSVNCQTGQSNFSATATPNVNSGTNFHGNWTITDLTAGTPPTTNPAWENCGPCTFSGYSFVQGHTYQITYTVQDTCTVQGSSSHTVTCYAGLVTQDGKEVNSRPSNSVVYPNPTSGVFTIDLTDLTADQILIYNAQGRVVQSIAVSEGKIRHHFDLSNQPNGMYLVTIRTQDGFITHKLIKE